MFLYPPSCHMELRFGSRRLERVVVTTERDFTAQLSDVHASRDDANFKRHEGGIRSKRKRSVLQCDAALSHYLPLHAPAPNKHREALSTQKSRIRHNRSELRQITTAPYQDRQNPQSLLKTGS